ncbi:MAG: NUDIX hydrolase [Zoogloeaceae bacterium]|nr:NUDIX hydrolase [Zoogloeaceae bacterium]
MNYCSHCGAPTTARIPLGDHLPRRVCDRCGIIHYQNPRLIVGALPVWQDQILLCRRAIEPQRNKWTLPSGFMENGETVAEAALRETREEANASIELDEIYTMISVPQINQVHIVYRAVLRDLNFSSGEESLEVRLFGEHEIPWNDIAFRSIALTLRHYFEDRRAGSFRFHSGDLPPL